VPLPPPVPKESLGAGYFPYALASHFLASGSRLVARSRSSSLSAQDSSIWVSTDGIRTVQADF